MRVMLIWQYYPEYVRSFYERRPGLADRSYREQLSALLDDGFGWPPLLLRRLAEQNHDVGYAMTNVKPLQRKWALEEGVEFAEGSYVFDLPLEHVRRFAPDVVWIGAMFPFYGDFLKRVRRNCSKVLAWIACPTPPRLSLSQIDHVLTSHSNLASKFSESGTSCSVLLPAFEPRIREAVGDAVRDISFSFVGSFSSFHHRRLELIELAIGATPLQLWGQGGLTRPGFMGWRSWLKRTAPWLWRTKLDGVFRGPAWGREMYAILGRSQTTLNIHGDIAGGLAGNMRLFEATGMGALLLTEAAPNLHELFVPDQEVVPYRNAKELVDRALFYLGRPDEAAKIACAGQRRTLREHSTQKRGEQLLEVINGMRGR